LGLWNFYQVAAFPDTANLVIFGEVRIPSVE
jgi:hypothetical protein